MIPFQISARQTVTMANIRQDISYTIKVRPTFQIIGYLTYHHYDHHHHTTTTSSSCISVLYVLVVMCLVYHKHVYMGDRCRVE